MEKHRIASSGRDGVLGDALAPWTRAQEKCMPSAILAPTSSWHRAMHCGRWVAGGDLMSIPMTHDYGGLATRTCYIESPLGLTIPSVRWCYYSQ